MLNIILIICEVIVAYIAMILLYKKYKTDGLITYTIIATVISPSVLYFLYSSIIAI